MATARREDDTRQGLRLICRGVVQGVGFRPAVAGLARSLNLDGRLDNIPGAVALELAGARPALERFLQLLPEALPAAARLEALQIAWLQQPLPAGLAPGTGLHLGVDAPRALGIGLVAPSLVADRAPCDACRRELRDPGDRRFRYPFLSCCSCGPRYSIATAEPFARAHTTLAAFPLCPACRAEFEDPADRRFHAETIGCPACGPQLRLLDERGALLVGALPGRRSAGRVGADPRSETGALTAEAARQRGPARAGDPGRSTDPGRTGEPAPATDPPDPDPADPEPQDPDPGVRADAAIGEDPLEAAVALLRCGRILALQGVGGFQLLVAASDPAAVARLRARKQRPHKPFALLVDRLERLAGLVQPSPGEREALEDPAAPIVLLPCPGGAHETVLTGVAPGAPGLGVMLPASPLHLLLAEAFAGPLVATSGNRSGEPLCTDPAEAVERLSGIADGFLVHDRPIARPLDDSLLQLIDGRPALLRRARGHAPQALTLPEPGSATLQGTPTPRAGPGNPARPSPSAATASAATASPATLPAAKLPAATVSPATASAATASAATASAARVSAATASAATPPPATASPTTASPATASPATFFAAKASAAKASAATASAATVSTATVSERPHHPGNAPDPATEQEEDPPILLGLGSDLKSAPALAIGGQFWLAPHLGDLAENRCLERWRAGLSELLERQPPSRLALAMDAHPQYLSRQLAPQLLPAAAMRSLQEVQHHRAHGLAVAAEHGLPLPLPALVLDGLGYGGGPVPLWGCELLLLEPDGSRRLASLRPFPLPGGERAVREPRRSALGLLWSAGLLDHPGAAAVRAAFRPDEIQLLLQAMGEGCNSPWCSSAGRLFDAVASLLDLVQIASHDAHGALLLQSAAARAPATAGTYPWAWLTPADDMLFAGCGAGCGAERGGARGAGSGAGRGAGSDAERSGRRLDEDERCLPLLDWQPLLTALLRDIASGHSPDLCAARFHDSLVQALTQAVSDLGLTRWGITGLDPGTGSRGAPPRTAGDATADPGGESAGNAPAPAPAVILAGGCFQNRRLLEGMITALRQRDLAPFWGERIPLNDGGLAIGQIQALRLAERGTRPERRS